MPRGAPKKSSASADGSWILENSDELHHRDPESQASSDEDDVWAIDSAPSSTRSKQAPTDEPLFVMPSPSTVIRASKRSPYEYEDEEETPQRTGHVKQQQQRHRREKVQYSPSKNTYTRHRQSQPAQLGQQGLSMGPPGTAPTSLLWTHFVLPTILYCTSLLGHSLAYLKPLFAILFAIWLVYFSSATILKSLFQPSALLTPICSAVPFSASIMPSICSGVPTAALVSTLWPFSSFSSTDDHDQTDFAVLMAEQAELQEPLFSPSSAALALPMEMKRSEASVRDLRSVVEYSTLPSRKLLAFELSSFVDAARQAGADLASFNSRVARAADAVILANRWTLSVLDDLAAKEDAARSTIGGGAGLLAWLNPFAVDPRLRSEAILRDQYLAHAGELSAQIDALVLEATTLLQLLASLDNHLDAIGSIAARDGLSAAGSRDELLANVWTWVGGNRRDRKRLEEQLRLLGDVGSFRRAAVEHVGGVIVRLQSVGAGLEGLRQRVGAATSVGEVEDGESEGGQLRIGEKVGRKTRERIPLRVHVESVQMGVERLEEARGEGRRLEGDVRREFLGGRHSAADKGGRKVVDGH